MHVGAAGCYLEDAHGNRLFDANAGLRCVNIGYGREEMVEAIREQVLDIPDPAPQVRVRRRRHEPAVHLQQVGRARNGPSPAAERIASSIASRFPSTSAAVPSDDRPPARLPR